MDPSGRRRPMTLKRTPHCSRQQSAMAIGDGATLRCSAARSTCRQDMVLVGGVEVKGDVSRFRLVFLVSDDNRVIIDGRGAGISLLVDGSWR